MRIKFLTGILVLAAWVLLGAALAGAQTCPNGATAPCAEDVTINGCIQCHGMQVPDGNRDETARWVTVASGSYRHQLAPRRVDWTTTVDSMIGKGAQATLESAAGYLNTNYCTNCSGPILGSPQVSSITDTTATVTWSTSANGFEDESADSVLFYGTNKADVLLGPGCSACQSVSDSTLVGHHVINLSGLSSFTEYFIVNQSTSARGTVRSSYAISFRTKRGGGGGGGCPGGVDPIPSRLYLSDRPDRGPYKVVAIDPATNTEIASIPVDSEPNELAPYPDGSTVYVTVGTNLAVIDVLGNIVMNTLLGVGDLFNHLAVSPDGSRLYLAYRKSTGTATLEVKVFDTTDPTAPALTTTISNPIFNGCYGPLGLAVSPDGSKLYLACRPTSSGLPDRFYLIDTATNTPTQTATFTRDSSNYTFINAIAVKPDGTRVYLARAHSSVSTVEIFDGSTGARVGAISLPQNALPRAAVVTPDGTRLYVVDQRLGTHVIDTTSNTRLTTLAQTTSRGLDIAMTPDGARVYSLLLFNLFVNDTATNTWNTTITGSFISAYQLTITPGRAGSPPPPCPPPVASRLYLSDRPDRGPYKVVAIDPATNTEIASIPVDSEPNELAPHPDSSTVYVTVGTNLVVIDVLGNIVTNTLLGVGDLFNHVVVSPNGSRLYLLYRKTAGTATLEVKVFDTTDPTAPALTTTITNPIFDGCYGPLGLAVSPDGSKLYLACRPTSSGLPDRFYLIDTATNIPTQTATFTRDSTNYTFINAMAVKPDGTRVYLARAHSNGSTVEVFDGSTGDNLGAISLPQDALPRAVVVTPDGTRLYVVDQRLGTHVIDTASNTLLTTLTQTTSRGVDIAINKDGTRVYSLLLFDLYVNDTATNTWVTTITGSFKSAYQLIITPGSGP